MSQATSFFALSNTGRCKNMIIKRHNGFQTEWRSSESE